MSLLSLLVNLISYYFHFILIKKFFLLTPNLWKSVKPHNNKLKTQLSVPLVHLCSVLSQRSGYTANPGNCWSQISQSCGYPKPPTYAEPGWWWNLSDTPRIIYYTGLTRIKQVLSILSRAGWLIKKKSKPKFRSSNRCNFPMTIISFF